MVINENVKRKIIPIASGKGGVGKSILAANLSLALSKYGKDTVVIDLDLGGSNLHTCLGLKNVNPGIGNFLSYRGMLFKDLILQTPYENLRFIPGDVLVSGVANVPFSQKKRLLVNILKLEADYIILDLGSGSSFSVIDFFLISNSGFIVTTSQTTAILNSYGFLKNLVFRFLQRAFAQHREVSRYLLSIIREKKPNVSSTISQILERIGEIEPEMGNKARKYVSILRPKIILNMAEFPDDLQIGEKLKDLILKNLEIEIECMGLIYMDKIVEQSLSELTPLLIYKSDSIAAKEIERIAQKIVQSDRFPEMPLDLRYYKDSFELALIEAKNDFGEIQALKKPEDNLDIGELLALISTQKKQINELRGTLRMLTMRNP